MRFSKKFIVLTSIIAMLGIPSIANAANTPVQKNINVLVEGKKVNFTTVKPQSVQGRTMVPLRAVFEAMGAKVEWDDKQRMVTATYKKGNRDVELKLKVGSTFIQRRIGDDNGNFRFLVQQLDIAPQIIQGNTLIPLRASGEALGSEVGWEAKTNTASLKFKGFLETEQSFPEYIIKGGSVWDVTHEELESFFATNKLRKDSNVKLPLALNIRLTEAARTKAKDGYDHNQQVHESPRLGKPEDFLIDQWIPYAFMGENLARGTTFGKQAIEIWYNSPGHLANILKAEYTDVGIGNHKSWWAQELIATTSPDKFQLFVDRKLVVDSFEKKISAATTQAEKDKQISLRDISLQSNQFRTNDQIDKYTTKYNANFKTFVSSKFPDLKLAVTEDSYEGLIYSLNGKRIFSHNIHRGTLQTEIILTEQGIKDPAALNAVKSILSSRLMLDMAKFEADVKELTTTNEAWEYRVYSLERIEFEYGLGDLYIRYHNA